MSWLKRTINKIESKKNRIKNQYRTVDWNPKITELRCNKCNHIEVEWYNTQPGDPCGIYTYKGCKGKMVRVLKENLEEAK